MTKIKVIQIAVAASNDDTWETLLLDDQGRVWHEVSYPTTWEQLELPDDPREATA